MIRCLTGTRTLVFGSPNSLVSSIMSFRTYCGDSLRRYQMIFAVNPNAETVNGAYVLLLVDQLFALHHMEL
jgi:hypothetical protein